MKTQHLVDMLARGEGAAPSLHAAPRLVPVAIGGAVVSATAALVLLGWIPREMYALPAPWIKLAYAGLLALAAAWLTVRLSRPVARVAAPARSVALVVLGMAVVVLGSLLATPGEERSATLLGASWLRCPVDVLLSSLPTLGGILHCARSVPTPSAARSPRCSTTARCTCLRRAIERDQPGAAG